MLTVNERVHSAAHAASPITPASIVLHITFVLIQSVIQSGQKGMITHVYSTVMFTT